MIIPVLKFCHKTTLIFFEIAVGILLLFFVLVAVLFWKLSNGPVDITFATDSIKKILVATDDKTDIRFSSIIAEWPKFSGPISIGLSGVVLTENKIPILNIPQLGIRIAKTPLLIGQIHPEAIIIKDSTIKLLRTKNGGLHLLVNDSSNPLPKNLPQKTNITIKQLGEAFFQGGTLPDYRQIKPLSKLQRFSVENARVIIIDEEIGKRWNIPTFDFEVLRKPNQFTIVANYKEDTGQNSNFSFLLEKDKKLETIRLYGEIDKINASTLARLFLPVTADDDIKFIVKSKVEGQFDKDWNLVMLDGKLSSDEGTLSLDGLYQSPLKFSGLQVNLSFDKKTNKITLHDSQIGLNNYILNMKGEKLIDKKSSIFALNLQMPDMSLDELQSLWPHNQKDTLAADWITKRMTKAKMKNINIMVPVDVDNIMNTNAEKIQASLDFENLTADYRAPLTPLSEAKGSAILKDDILSVALTSGKIGDIDVKRGKIDIPHLTHPTLIGDALIDADMTGNVASFLNYIRLDPINLGEKIPLDPKNVKGLATVNGQVSFPALKDLPKDQVKVVATVKMNDVVLPKIVRGMDLTGGPFDLSVNKGVVIVSGKGALNAQPIQLTYTEHIDPQNAPFISSAQAEIKATKDIRQKFGVKLDDFMEGDVPVKIDYQQKINLDETVNIIADLSPIIVKFAPFKYNKPIGRGGQASCDVMIKKGDVQTVKNLKIKIDKAGEASGQIAFGKVGSVWDVKTGQFSNITLAGANNFSLNFNQSAPDLFDVTIKGKQLDARPFLGGASDKTSGGTSRVNAVVNVSQIKTGDRPEQLLRSPSLSLRTSANGDVAFMDLKGSVDGGSISVQISPNSAGKTTLAIKSDNAGSALKTLDIYDNIIGGQMDIKGTQITGGGINDIVGRGMVTNFTIVKAPFLAKIINLFSLSGLTELLQNKGIEFKSLKTDFEWKDIQSTRIISLRNGRTTGASIGLTFGGTINQDEDKLDISGTFVPVSEINSIFNKIPLIGTLLTGGKNGGIIAATYSMKGKSENPTVLLNPLSVLTPGFLRSILFENDQTDFDSDNDKTQSRKSPQKRSVNN